MAYQKNKSITDALNVLMELSEEDCAVGSRELARRLNMEPTRVNRFLRTLHEAGFAAQDSNQRYHSGAGMEVMAARSLHNSKLLRAGLPVIEKLGKCKFQVALGVLHRNKVCYLYHAAVGMSLAEGIGRMAIYEASRSSIGMMLLAGRSDQYIAEFYAHDDADCGEFSSFAELMHKITEIRREKFTCIACSVNNPLINIAVPIGKPVLGALAFSGITEQELKKTTELLIKIADEING
jgi:DNA-binding IclR family transcriptional regulator